MQKEWFVMKSYSSLFIFLAERNNEETIILLIFISISNDTIYNVFFFNLGILSPDFKSYSTDSKILLFFAFDMASSIYIQYNSFHHICKHKHWLELKSIFHYDS